MLILRDDLLRDFPGNAVLNHAVIDLGSGRAAVNRHGYTSRHSTARQNRRAAARGKNRNAAQQRNSELSNFHVSLRFSVRNCPLKTIPGSDEALQPVKVLAQLGSSHQSVSVNLLQASFVLPVFYYFINQRGFAANHLSDQFTRRE